MITASPPAVCCRSFLARTQELAADRVLVPVGVAAVAAAAGGGLAELVELEGVGVVLLAEACGAAGAPEGEAREEDLIPKEGEEEDGDADADEQDDELGEGGPPGRGQAGVAWSGEQGRSTGRGQAGVARSAEQGAARPDGRGRPSRPIRPLSPMAAPERRPAMAAAGPSLGVLALRAPRSPTKGVRPRRPRPLATAALRRHRLSLPVPLAPRPGPRTARRPRRQLVCLLPPPLGLIAAR
uniref:Uncharacterized protein n=1 Tax=Setaria viridis TaxID=4556 RepID=A0A4V6Y7W7_SETVI|nr:hypothetical protein SEVIR_8G048700v2 [Setaria viridis]